MHILVAAVVAAQRVCLFRLLTVNYFKPHGGRTGLFQRSGSGVTLTNMFGRRFKVSTVIFRIRLCTFSGSS
jgi:hypothetical protein